MRVPRHLSYHGSTELLQRRSAAILNSRQSKRPCGADAWVRATTEAVKAMSQQGHLLLTSVGMNTWELLVHLADREGASQMIILPIPGDCTAEAEIARIVSCFDLDRHRVGVLSLPGGGSARARRSTGWPERDTLVVKLAEKLAPVSLRRGGNLEGLLQAAAQTGVVVDQRFSVEYQVGTDRVRYELDDSNLNPSLLHGKWEYLTHWTRSSHTPYPGETARRYYEDIVTSDKYPRAAVDTLARIISERRLRASGRFMRAGLAVVSLTSLHPREAATLMRWRRRYVYYNFEPYGIAIHKDAAARLGTREVVYGPAEQYRRLPSEARAYFQNEGKAGTGWKAEAEYRVVGDMDLRLLDPDEIRIIVYRRRDREKLPRDCPYQVTPLTRF